jgi:hypothetical protein
MGARVLIIGIWYNPGRGSTYRRGKTVQTTGATSDYNNKFFEIAHDNSNAAFDFIQKMSGVRSPSAFMQLSTEHARKQLELLTEQAKQLATLAQKATLATAEPIKTASQQSVSLKL